MGVTAADWALYRAFADEGRLTLRITGYAAGMEAMEAIAPLRPTPWLHDDRLRLVGIKIYGDGALGSRGAWLLSPYADAPKTSGLRFHDDARLKNLFSRANFLGYQIAHHAIGTAANRQALDAFAEIAKAYGNGFRNRIEHAQVVDPSDLARFAEIGVIASVQPIHAVSDRTMAEQRLTPAALEGAYAWASLRRAGARLALGSDTPVEPANPFLGLHAAVTRRDAAGQPPGGWRREQALDMVQAFAGFTIDAAYAGHAEQRVGTLAPGKWADFLLLDRDPFRIDPDELPTIRVVETWVAGRRVFVAAD
jgi:predicted amidohydrolase YtcJ